MNTYAPLDAWIDAHFDEQVRFLQELPRTAAGKVLKRELREMVSG